MINWCWWEWWFKFSILKNRIIKLKFFDINKIELLYSKIEINCCNPHDDLFDKWGWIIDFIKANYKFSNDLILILHWTNTIWRFYIFITSFILLNIFWIRFFNWTYWNKKV